MKRILIAISLVLVLSVPSLLAQAQRDVRLFTKASGVITIDGGLDEPAWKQAPEAGGLLRLHAQGLEPGVLSTSVKILYDSSTLYIGFDCLDAQPERIVTRGYESNADIRNDDSVYILVDAGRGDDLYDVFGTNTRHIPFQAQISKDGQFYNPCRRGEWKVDARKTATGWTVEFGIPLNVLSPEKGLSALGILFGRVVPRYSRSFWNGPLDPAFDLTALGSFGELDLVHGGSRTNLQPFFLGMTGGAKVAQPGVEIQHQFSRNLSASAAVNPDFVTVEDYDEIINLTRFELRYPERRSFLQDQAGIYDTQIPVFYTKRIGDIWGGVRFDGAAGGLQFAGMSTQTKENTISGPDSANFSVLRVKETTGAFSLGAIAVNKAAGGTNTGAAGIDASFLLTKAWRFDGQAVMSYGASNEGASALAIESRYDTDNLHARAGYTYLGDHFGDNVNVFGFIQDDNRKEVDGDLEVGVPVKLGKLSKVRLSTENYYYHGMDDTLRGWQTSNALSFDFGPASTLSLTRMEEYVLFEKSYRNNWTRLMITWNPNDRWTMSSVAVYTGNIFGGAFMMFDLMKGLAITPEVRSELHVTRLDYDPAAIRNPYNHNATGWAVDLRFYADLSERVTSSFIVHMATREDRGDVGIPGTGYADMRYTKVRSYYQLMVQYKVLPPYGLIQAGFQHALYEYDLPGRVKNGIFVKFNVFL